MALLFPAFSAAAQHHGGGMASPPSAASRPAGGISRVGLTTTHVAGSRQSPVRPAAARVVETRNGLRVIRNHGANFVFNETDFQDVPGLGFDYPHLAAISGNRRVRGNRFAGGVPFGFSGFLLSPSIIEEDVPVSESSIAGAQSSAADDQEVADDARPAAHAPHLARSPRRIEPEADTSLTAPRADEQYVFVRRDGSLVFAIAYAWESSTLRYISPDGLRRSIGRDALDLAATQQFNEQRGLSFRAPG